MLGRLFFRSFLAGITTHSLTRSASVHVFVILSNVERKLVFTYDFLIAKRCGSGSKTKASRLGVSGVKR